MNRETALGQLMIEDAKEWRRLVIGEAPHTKADPFPPAVPTPEQVAAHGKLVSAKPRGDRRKEYDRENQRRREARAAARSQGGQDDLPSLTTGVLGVGRRASGTVDQQVAEILVAPLADFRPDAACRRL